MDGLIEPLDTKAGLNIVEFQMQPERFIFHRSVIERTYLQMEQYPRKVRAIIVFGSRSQDLYTDESIEELRQLVTVVYLDEAINKLSATQPNHFLVALFRPLVESEKSVVEKLAPIDYDLLKSVQSGDSTFAGLETIFVDWLMQLFKTKTRKEIAKMIAELTPIEDTVAGRELIQIGEERGMERGMECLILELIEDWLGQISPESKKGISDLPVEDLPVLGRALRQMPDIAALESWLRLRLVNSTPRI